MADINFEAAEQFNNDVIRGFIDKNLVDKTIRKIIDDTIELHGKKIFSLLIYKLTHLKLQPAQAKEMWDGILIHMQRLNKLLRRDVGINVASMDYMVNIANKNIQSPIIVDENYLSDLKKDIIMDNISGLYNQNYYHKRIQQEIAEAKRYHHPLSILVISLPHLLKITEYSGNEAANEIITAFGQVLIQNMRVSDIGIRYKTDEFICMLPNTTRKGALVIARKLKHKIDELIKNKQISISIGAAVYPVDASIEPSELYAMAKNSQQNKFPGVPESQLNNERRKHQRITMQNKIGVRIEILNPQILSQKINKLNDISKGGIGLNLNQLLLREKDIIEGIVKRNNQEIKFSGQIIWTDQCKDSTFNVGVKFI